MRQGIGESEAEAVRQAAEKMGQDLRSARQARRWTQADAAWCAGMSLATYKRMEAGDVAVAMGFWLQAWLKIGLLEQLADATSPHRDAYGERMRRIRVNDRVRRAPTREQDWDY